MRARRPRLRPRAEPRQPLLAVEITALAVLRLLLVAAMAGWPTRRAPASGTARSRTRCSPTSPIGSAHRSPSAVEEQRAAADETARSVRDSSRASSGVNHEITHVTGESRPTNAAAVALADDAWGLRDAVGRLGAATSRLVGTGDAVARAAPSPSLERF